MGEIVRSGADQQDVFTDCQATLAAARLRDDAWKAPAQERLAPLVEMQTALETERRALAEAAIPLVAGIDKADAEADVAIVREVENLFDKGGRRRNDPWLLLLAPGGAAAYADGPTNDQPLRMTLFAKLLRKLGHKRIPKAETDAAAARVEAAAVPLAAAIAAAATPRAELALVDRTLTALSRIMRLELVALKQGWKSAGFSESEIHEVIPDRPSDKPKKETPPSSPTPPAEPTS